MFKKKKVQPVHINASSEDMLGNDGFGRYFLLPGSPGRANRIALEFFDDLEIKRCDRGHDLYLGSLHRKGQKIDIATISTGMGCSSFEIILTELLHLGARHLLRVGTAGSLQAKTVKTGDFINVRGSIRDEEVSRHYLPVEYPALATYSWVDAIAKAAKQDALSERLHTGIVHCKSDFYGREMGEGPMSNSNAEYMGLLRNTGVLASEMETSILFVLSTIYAHVHGKSQASDTINAGALLAIVNDDRHAILKNDKLCVIESNLAALALDSVLCFHDSLK